MEAERLIERLLANGCKVRTWKSGHVSVETDNAEIRDWLALHGARSYAFRRVRDGNTWWDITLDGDGAVPGLLEAARARV